MRIERARVARSLRVLYIPPAGVSSPKSRDHAISSVIIADSFEAGRVLPG